MRSAKESLSMNFIIYSEMLYMFWWKMVKLNKPYLKKTHSSHQQLGISHMKEQTQY